MRRIIQKEWQLALTLLSNQIVYFKITQPVFWPLILFFFREIYYFSSLDKINSYFETNFWFLELPFLTQFLNLPNRFQHGVISKLSRISLLFFFIGICINHFLPPFVLVNLLDNFILRHNDPKWYHILMLHINSFLAVCLSVFCFKGKEIFNLYEYYFIITFPIIMNEEPFMNINKKKLPGCLVTVGCISK